MTLLNFLLTRCLARTLSRGDEVLDEHARPRRERLPLARARARPRDRRPLRRRARGSDARPRRSRAPALRANPRCGLSDRLDEVGSAPDVGRIVEPRTCRRGRRATPSTTGRTANRRRRLGRRHLICSPYKYFGQHMGLAFGKRELLESWRPCWCAGRERARRPPLRDGPQQHELLALRGGRAFHRIARWDAIVAHEHDLGQRFLDGLPSASELNGFADGGPGAHLLLNVAGRSAEGRGRARRAGDRRLARPLLRRRGDAAPGARGRGSRSRWLRPLQHRRRGRPAAGGAGKAGVSSSSAARAFSAARSPRRLSPVGTS